MEKLFQKVENKMDLIKLTKKLFIIFIILQPILDIYMSLFDSKIQILGMSLATIIRFLWVFVMMIFVMIHARKNKSTKIFIGYGILVAIYTVFHHINAVGFKIQLAEAKYSMLAEILYLARMCIPAVLIYIIYNIKPNYKDIRKMVITVSLIISVSLIVSNLFKVSYLSYSLDKDYNTGNIIEWFSKGIEAGEDTTGWVGYTSRGLFQSGNQLSGVTVILVPVLTYIAFKEKRIREWIVLTLHIIAMICITTRVGAIGGIAAMILVTCIYVLQKIIHKEISMDIFKRKNLYCCIAFFIIIGIFFIYSPFKVRASSGNLGYDMGMNNKQTANNVKPNINTGTDEEIDKLAYIEENIDEANINGYFPYQAYPYTEDVDFWFDLIMNVPEYQRAGNRKMRALLIDRLLQRDNRLSNYIWGISFTRSSSFVWPERDFETQFDALGITGSVLFIAPYVIILLAGIVNFFKKFKDNLYLSKVIYMIAMVMGLFAAYSSGHILNEMFPFIYLALMTAIVFNMCFGDDPEVYEKKRNLRKYFDKLYEGGKEKFHSEIKEALVSEEKRFIVTANPETLMIAEKNEEFKECLLQDYVTIVPDGIGIIKGAKMLEYPQKETITGVGLVESLFEVCNENKKSVFLFGAKPEVVSKLNEVIKQKYTNINVVGFENGYVKDKQEVFERIQECNPDLILVALGIPNQELLIDKNFEKFNKGIFIGVGGSFDVLSGMKKRAPKIFIKLHLEWLYRITTEPKRIKRFIDSNVKYLFKLSEEK
ncbi:MAG: WecB/TagA/CpsF family glycosyltransferase [Clostridia bacterium]|nr:WecB/TagA/CpsF family glycosyltransferase [Clostridia bacterium]